MKSCFPPLQPGVRIAESSLYDGVFRVVLRLAGRKGGRSREELLQENTVPPHFLLEIFP